jgi:hypothetical protein
MPCKSCKSENLQTLDAEFTVSQPNLKDLSIPPVYVTRSILVCLDCGFSETVIPADKLPLLKRGESAFSS